MRGSHGICSPGLPSLLQVRSRAWVAAAKHQVLMLEDCFEVSTACLIKSLSRMFGAQLKLG